MIIYFGSDQHGTELRPKLVSYVTDLGYLCKDLGIGSDYPLITQDVVKEVLRGRDSKGILICETGQGVAMAANRYQGIRATACNTIADAKQSREHLDANILAIGADNLNYSLAEEIVKTFLNTEFSREERHKRRIKQLEKQQ